MTPIRFIAAIGLSLATFIPVGFAQKVDVVNNQPFPIRMPWRMLDGTNVLIDVPAAGKQTIDAAGASTDAKSVSVSAGDNGLRLKAFDQDMGLLQWDLIIDKIDKRPSDEESANTKRDYDAEFKALPLKFTKSGNNKLFETWSAKTEKWGVKLAIEVDVYPAGFVDLRGTFTNESAPTKSVYAAVVTRWQRPAGTTSTVNYDNHIAPLPAGGATPFRAGEGRHLFLQRGVDWINTSVGDASVAWLNDFAQSFTIHHPKTTRTAAQWRGGNAPQLGQEAVVSGDTLYSVTEIARPIIKYYQSRFTGNTLPEKEDPLHFSSLLALAKEKLSDERVDQMFVGYTSYNEEKKAGDSTQLSLGVPFVKFGTAYFPYSTLGENFEAWHMPGMSKESYWPLAADVVKNYKLFADDIRRDLRIAKAMGFQTIRLHHLEMIDTLDKATQDAFLDFYFGELKNLGLTALVDVKLPPARTAELVKKYRDQIDGVEVDNEVLIFGMPDDDVPGWKETYKAVKAVAPDMPVHLTSQTNTGAYDRLKKLDVPFDKVGVHCYMDSVDAIPSARDYALAMSDYGSEIGKPPTATEWNWRFLTRMTPENRAKIYPPIFENVFATRSIPVFYQFQFNESLAMASKTLRGIRHYDLLALSRRPRPEALEFIKLIRKYGDPSAPQQILQTNYQFVTLQDVQEGKPRILVSVTNLSDKKLSVTATPEGPKELNLTLNGATKFEIEPKQTVTTEINATFPPDALPGFYNAFVRFDAGDNLVSYAWVEIRKPGGTKINKEKGYHPEVTYSDDALDYDFNRDIAVVYPAGREKDSRWDVESAWLILQTLESATGRPVKIFQENDLPDDLRKSGNLIRVEMPGWNGSTQPTAGAKSWVSRQKANSEHGDTLIVAGNDEASLNRAAIDLVLRYWQFAKDAGMRRVPLTDQPIFKGPDPSLLP